VLFPPPTVFLFHPQQIGTFTPRPARRLRASGRNKVAAQSRFAGPIALRAIAGRGVKVPICFCIINPP
jgi:hypothetical protein